MFHPDTQTEIIRSFQNERLQAAQKNRLLNQTQTRRPSLRDRFLLWTGEWMITLGTNLKSQVREPVCA